MRRGMGAGRGSGYHNIIGKDPQVHSQSARGMKQPQFKKGMEVWSKQTGAEGTVLSTQPFVVKYRYGNKTFTRISNPIFWKKPELRPTLHGWYDVAPFKRGKDGSVDRSIPFRLTTKDYYEIGKSEGLEGRNLKRFSALMLLRFPENTGKNYAREWARRFRKGAEYDYADLKTTDKLKFIDAHPNIQSLSGKDPSWDLPDWRKSFSGKDAPEGWVFVDWKDADGKTWHDTIPRAYFHVFQLKVMDKGGRIMKSGKSACPTLHRLSKKDKTDIMNKVSKSGLRGMKAIEYAEVLAQQKMKSGKDALRGGFGDVDEKGHKLLTELGSKYIKGEISKEEYIQKQKEFLKGGLGDNRPDSDFNRRELKVGQKVEMEHTDNPTIAKEIVKDHLVEHPKGYYKGLAKLEKRLSKSGKSSFDPQILFKQLGGQKFKAMTGAKDFRARENTLIFRIPKAKVGINTVKITYNEGKDLYDMEFFAGNFKREKVTGLYADQLQTEFTRITGLYTHL